ncbi:MAG: hypothetical protein Q9162_005391 [Coniocarpon cinnabarinum]
MAPLKPKSKDARSRVGTPSLGDNSEQPSGSSNGTAGPSGQMSYEDILDKHCKSATPPPSAVLKKIHEALVVCRDVAKERSEACDKGMREASRKRKDLFQLQQQQEIEEARAEEERQAELQRGQKEEDAKSRPPAVGARGLAPQDGTVNSGSADPSSNQTTSPAQAQQPVASPTKSSSSDEPHQPRPAPTIPKYNTFGDDPTTFDDPTIYHIRDIHEGLSEEEKKEILGVAEYPHDDLHDKTAGTPPDRDFSNSKPANQVSFQHFTTYLEPYVRSITQEDIAFLDERGDRSAPFDMPPRGQHSYKETWADEDGVAPPASTKNQTPAQPSGGMEQMNDEAAENGSVTTGPVLARLLATMIPERRAPTEPNTNGVNGDTANHVNGEVEGNAEVNGDSQAQQPLPPAAQMAEASMPGWKAPLPKTDYAALDARALQELRYAGLLNEDEEPNYDGHYDDEVAARLRYLQGELRRVSIINGARKARVKDLAVDAMAKQEFNAIAEDVDSQLNQAYLKRHRNIGKGKKVAKRPSGPAAGQIGGIALSRPGLGEPIKTLMDKRDNWRDILGPLVDYGSGELPHGTIFGEAEMKEYYQREQEAWADPAE